MIKLHEFLNVIRYEIDDKAFLNNSIYTQESSMVCEVTSGTPEYYITCIFDAVSQEVFEISVEDYERKRYYRWIQEDFRDLEQSNRSWAGTEYSLLEVAEDILDKADAIVEGRDYDSRVRVPLDLSDEDFMFLAKAAHDRDITLNAMVEQVLKAALENVIKNEK
jgi:hypothetical protein